MENIVIGGGCFWCLEAVYQLVEGVTGVESGYTNGEIENPTYRQVCEGDSGHVEVVKITFNPEKISLEKIFEIFWVIHDPTTLNRQGNDSGTQYRSGIYFQNELEKKIAIASKELHQRSFSNPIITEIVSLKHFYKAEAYHQNYYRDNPNASYCAYVVKSKVDKYLKKFTQ
jgi:peptide-methionine (S)-S-oxide reductase